MPTEFKIPELGENVSAGDVVRVLVKAGDTLEKDQTVLELETDKATIEVPSNVSGNVGEVKVKPGDKVMVGQVVLTLTDGAGAPAGTAAAEPAEKTDKPADEKRATPAKPAAKADKSATEKADKSAAAAEKDDKTDKGASKAKPQPLGAPQEGGL